MRPTPRLGALAAQLLDAHPPRHRLRLTLEPCTITVATNSESLATLLARYFDVPASDEADGSADVHVAALVANVAPLPLAFQPWPRDPARGHPKELFADVPDGRAVLKARTGLQFLSGGALRLVVGRCDEHPHQVINFILAQCISRRVNAGWLPCHAAAVALTDAAGHTRGLAIAAGSGAGKSTLALRLLREGASFVSNDRVLVRSTSRGAELAGLAKMPRVNPGTLLASPELRGILPPARERELRALPRAMLWALEEKYDVDVKALYGSERCRYGAPLAGVLVLSWCPHRSDDVRFSSIALEERTGLMDTIMKEPGPFHCDRTGQPGVPGARPSRAEYERALAGVPVFEATGKFEVERAVMFCMDLLRGRPC